MTLDSPMPFCSNWGQRRAMTNFPFLGKPPKKPRTTRLITRRSLVSNPGPATNFNQATQFFVVNSSLRSLIVLAVLALTGFQQPAANASEATEKPSPEATVTSSESTNKTAKVARRFSYTPRPYPVDERGFSPVDKALAKAYAREETITDDDEGALNP